MSYGGKCSYCIPIKPACLVLAITSAVVNGLIVVWYIFIWGFAFMVSGLSGGPSLKMGGVSVDRGIYVNSDVWKGMGVNWYSFGAPIVALLNLIFSALLCNGICNNQPKQVKAYFWYGVVTTLLMAIGSVVLLCICSNYPKHSDMMWILGLILLGTFILHALFLVLVHLTHKKVVEDTMDNGSIRRDDRNFSEKRVLVKVEGIRPCY